MNKKPDKMTRQLNRLGLAKQVEELCLQTAFDHTPQSGGRFSALFAAFSNLFSNAGLSTSTEYPFTTKDGGRRAFRKHVTKVRTLKFLSQLSEGDKVVARK